MKTNCCRYFAVLGLAGMALASSASLALAQEDYVVSAFDTDADVGRWARWWGAAPQTYEFDATVDANNNSSSGSLKATVDFDLATYAGDNQFAVRGDFADGAVLDGTKYTQLVFDIRWDPSSPKTSGGNFGSLEFGLGPSDWSQIGLGSTNVPTSAAEGWLHVVAPIDPATAKLDAIPRVWLKIWSGGSGGLTGQTVFWVDNIKLIANTNLATPPPKMELVKASPGLQLSASAAGQQYQRQNIRTLTTDPDGNAITYSWVGSANPVTYSVTIKDFPDAAHSGFQAHIFLVPESSMPYGAGDTSIDWNAANMIFIQIANNADGTGTGRFMYKTNLPSGNSMIWNTDPSAGPVGTLASISDASPRGTWSVTFKNNTEITMTNPAGASTNFALPSDAAALFADPLVAYFGVQPNQLGNIGQSAVFSRVQITGVATPLDDNFTGETLDTTKLAVTAADATGIILVPPSAAYWLKWTAPATGFNLQASPTLASGSWVDPGLINVVQVGSQKVVLVPSTNLPSATKGFYRLVKP